MPAFSSQLLFLFSALGAVNGIFLSLYLLSRPTQRLANGMLAALLLAIGFRTVKSTFYYFKPDLAVEFLQFGLSACLLIGPLTYLYVHCSLADLNRQAPAKRWHWHLAASLGLIGVGLVFPYSAFPHIWRYSIHAIHPFWLSYLLLTAWELWQSRASLTTIDTRMPRQTILLVSVFVSSCLILLAYASTPFTSYIVGALSFTFSVHVSILSYLLRNEPAEIDNKKEKYQNRKLAEGEVVALLHSLNQVMTEERLYLNPNLSLALLAKKVGNLQTTVSQVINENLGKSFNVYINEFRIQYAQSLLLNESHLNMELVAERSGFNSNSTFFAAFKKVTNQTPANYRAAFVTRSTLAP